MRRVIVLIAAVALLAAAAPAAKASNGVPYAGKGSGGQTVTFRFAKGRMWDFATGIPMQCLAIQGGGAPISGAEPWVTDWVRLGLEDHKITDYAKPAFHPSEVTRNHTVNTSHRRRDGTISGSIRLQYAFLIPKYPIGTFSVYSCLGNTTWTAKPVR
jgi:hypothetical protein